MLPSVPSVVIGNNNLMLKHMMAVKGRLPNKLIKAHMRRMSDINMDTHFEVSNTGPIPLFKCQEVDVITQNISVRFMNISEHPSINIHTMISKAKGGSEDGGVVDSLVDLLDKMLVLDANKRISVSNALKHPFFTGKK